MFLVHHKMIRNLKLVAWEERQVFGCNEIIMKTWNSMTVPWQNKMEIAPMTASVTISLAMENNMYLSNRKH
jgi:hypothetical protein